jgi:hypothetical protein
MGVRAAPTMTTSRAMTCLLGVLKTTWDNRRERPYHHAL